MNILGKILVAKAELQELENRVKAQVHSCAPQYFPTDMRTNDQVTKDVVFACNDLIVKIMLESDL